MLQWLVACQTALRVVLTIGDAQTSLAVAEAMECLAVAEPPAARECCQVKDGAGSRGWCVRT
jgi:hypothetical protein